MRQAGLVARSRACVPREFVEALSDTASSDKQGRDHGDESRDARGAVQLDVHQLNRSLEYVDHAYPGLGGLGREAVSRKAQVGEDRQLRARSVGDQASAGVLIVRASLDLTCSHASPFQGLIHARLGMSHACTCHRGVGTDLVPHVGHQIDEGHENHVNHDHVGLARGDRQHGHHVSDLVHVRRQVHPAHCHVMREQRLVVGVGHQIHPLRLREGHHDAEEDVEHVLGPTTV